jgi:hypothetical protein
MACSLALAWRVLLSCPYAHTTCPLAPSHTFSSRSQGLGDGALQKGVTGPKGKKKKAGKEPGEMGMGDDDDDDEEDEDDVSRFQKKKKAAGKGAAGKRKAGDGGAGKAAKKAKPKAKGKAAAKPKPKKETKKSPWG